MQYRTMPGKNDKLSALGYGCMRLPTKGKGLLGSIDVEAASRQIKHAIDNGVNYLDTAYPYHMGNSESFLGEYILRDGYREKVNIATKLPCFTINKAGKAYDIFEKQITKLQVDYIDYYLLHSLNGSTWNKMVSLGIFDFIEKIKKEGRIRNMGFSFHGTYDAFRKIVDSYDWDFCQIQYNIIDENFQAGIRGIKYAAEKGMGVIVMEPLKGGILTKKIPGEIKKIYERSDKPWSPAEWGLRWVLNNPDVTMVLSGMNEDSHVDENIRVCSDALPDSMTDEDVSLVESIRSRYLGLMEVGCTGCGYCMPCPAGINIPGAFKDLNNYSMFSKTSSKFSHMAFTGIITDDGKPHWAKACIDCGKCEEACPQDIEVRKELAKVTKNLEGPGMRTLASIGRVFVR